MERVSTWLGRFRRLSPEQRQVLHAIAAGWTLKSHRYLDGEKIYRLHSLGGEEVDVPAPVVENLVRRRLIQSNQKFPAATYLLTEKGVAVAGPASDPQDGASPLSARNFLADKVDPKR